MPLLCLVISISQYPSSAGLEFVPRASHYVFLALFSVLVSPDPVTALEACADGPRQTLWMSDDWQCWHLAGAQCYLTIGLCALVLTMLFALRDLFS